MRLISNLEQQMMVLPWTTMVWPLNRSSCTIKFFEKTNQILLFGKAHATRIDNEMEGDEEMVMVVVRTADHPLAVIVPRRTEIITITATMVRRNTEDQIKLKVGGQLVRMVK